MRRRCRRACAPPWAPGSRAGRAFASRRHAARCRGWAACWRCTCWRRSSRSCCACATASPRRRAWAARSRPRCSPRRVSALVIALLGVPLAYLLARPRGAAGRMLTALVALPLALPPLMSGLLLLYVLGPRTAAGELFGGAADRIAPGHRARADVRGGAVPGDLRARGVRGARPGARGDGRGTRARAPVALPARRGAGRAAGHRRRADARRGCARSASSART